MQLIPVPLPKGYYIYKGKCRAVLFYGKYQEDWYLKYTIPTKCLGESDYDSPGLPQMAVPHDPSAVGVLDCTNLQEQTEFPHCISNDTQESIMLKKMLLLKDVTSHCI